MRNWLKILVNSPRLLGVALALILFFGGCWAEEAGYFVDWVTLRALIFALSGIVITHTIELATIHALRVQSSLRYPPALMKYDSRITADAGPFMPAGPDRLPDIRKGK